MRIEVVVPDNNTGDVIGDLVARRGQVVGLEMHSVGLQAIKGTVPLAEMVGYATSLRSSTQGRHLHDGIRITTGSPKIVPARFSVLPRSG